MNKRGYPDHIQQQQIMQGAMPMVAQAQPQMLMQNQMMQYGMHPQMMMQGANGVVFPVMQQDQISMYSALSKREQQIEAQSEPLAPVLGGQPPAKRFRGEGLGLRLDL